MFNVIKTLALALLVLGCSAPFEHADLDAIGGDTGAAGEPVVGGEGGADAGAGGTGSHAAGSSSSAGKPTAGSSAGGTPSAGGQPTAGTGGTVTPSCELDEAKLTAALPSSFVWETFVRTGGEDCVACKSSPCSFIDVISWGSPTSQGSERTFTYSPNIDKSSVAITFGNNDGACAAEHECGAAPSTPTITVTANLVDGIWQITDAQVDVAFESNTCIATHTGAGLQPVAPMMGIDLADELEATLKGLKIPCAG